MEVDETRAGASRRVAALVEYDGTGFAGWQSQAHAVSIQDAVESAIGFVAGHPVLCICAGRTDAGVHATGQIIHFDSTALRTARAWVLGANTKLPAGRRLAVGRRSRRMSFMHGMPQHGASTDITSSTAAPVRGLSASGAPGFTGRSILLAMHRAAQALIGEHDFSAFRSVECQSKTPMRRVHRICVERTGDTIWLEIEANAYLHHMVRNIVGTLVLVQSDAAPAAAMTRILAGGDRRAAGVTAPAEGLYLWRVEYPARYGIPAPVEGIW